MIKKKSVLDVYSDLAQSKTATHIEMSGRYRNQSAAVRRVAVDVLSKLELRAEDSLLDIGCGVGDISIPLSMLCDEVTLVDHPKVLAQLKRRIPREERVTFMPGDFLSLDFDQTYDKILAYGVVVCLPDEESVLRFLRKTIQLCSPGGRILIGDLANSDKKARFAGTEFGRTFAQAWEKDAAKRGARARAPAVKALAEPVSVFPRFSDQLVLRMVDFCRREGAESYLLPQPVDLPFGHTREDLLIIKRC